MGQRKLTDEQRIRARNIASSLMSIPGGNVGVLRTAYDMLLMMDGYGTTDGKPYVEPQPEIGEGYRVATDADAGRKDREVWNGEKWFAATFNHFYVSHVLRVPIDRIPTDDDARERPLVMVRDSPAQAWQKHVLVAVDARVSSYQFYVQTEFGSVTCWVYCRFPYPGE